MEKGGAGYQHFLIFPLRFLSLPKPTSFSDSHLLFCLNLLPDVPILGSSNLAANKDMMSRIWISGDTDI